MASLFRRLFALGVGCLAVGSAWGFSLQGPQASWMTLRVGYEPDSHFGGPMMLTEEYRWNVPVIYYAFSPEFKLYFGDRGVREIEKVFTELNALPPASRMDPNAFPLTSQRVNHRAQALGITDIRSGILSWMTETMGLAEPARYVFTIRNRWTTSQPDTTNYYIIRRNYDPITWLPSSFINGDLWTYTGIAETAAGKSVILNEPVDPLALLGVVRSPVTAFTQGLLSGGFWTGFTRDDIGGLRYLYRPQNINMESHQASVTGTLGGGPWGDPGSGTNQLGTNTVSATNIFVNTGLRIGRDKLTYRRVEFDSMLGFFEPFTNTWTDSYITNGTAISQAAERAVVAPDILFHVADLQLTDANDLVVGYGSEFQPWLIGTSTNSATGGGTNTTAGFTLGPGVIGPGSGGSAFIFTFNSINEIFWNTFPFDNLDEASAGHILLWGSFDGSTNEPYVYPVGAELQDVEARILGSDRGDPWNQP